MPQGLILLKAWIYAATALLWCNDDGAGCGGSSCSTSGLKGLIQCLKP